MIALFQQNTGRPHFWWEHVADEEEAMGIAASAGWTTLAGFASDEEDAAQWCATQQAETDVAYDAIEEREAEIRRENDKRLREGSDA